MATRESFDWWADGLEPNERGERSVKAQKLICNLPQEMTRRDLDIFNIRLYENNPILTLYTFAGQYYAETNAVSLPPPEQSVNNKAKAAIDTLAAQIASTEQRARFRTVDGNGKQRRRARELQNFSDGLAHDLELHKKKQRAFTDAAVLESGVGAIQFYRDGDRVGCKRRLATELSIDPLDGLVDGQWRTIYSRTPVPRDVVMATYYGDGKGKDAERIKKAIEDAPTVSVSGAPADHIEVFECWHLPSTKKAKDGWHVTGLDIADGVMAVEPYKKNHHEIVFFSLEDRFTTGWGLSLMTQVRPLQTRVNANTYRIERAQKLFHAGHIYVDRNLKLKKSSISNEIGSVWEGNGPQGPQQILFNAVTQEMYNQVEIDGRRIFENLGISVSASQAETNSGLNASAAAKREDTAKSDQRNAVRQQRWERFHVDCIKTGLGIVRDIDERTADGKKRDTKGGYKTMRADQRGMTSINWRDVALDEEDYVLDVQPASPIPTTSAGLVAFGEHMLEIGEWQPGTLSGYMQDLDADGRINLARAVERQLSDMFESMLYDDVSSAQPDEFTNYAKAIEIGAQYLALGRDEKVPDKKLDRVRRYLRACQTKQKQVAAMNAPPAAAAAPPDQAQQAA